MVTKVLKWRNTLHNRNNSNTFDNAYVNEWDELSAYNKRFESLLQTLHALHQHNTQEYLTIMRQLARSPAHEWDIIFEGSGTYESRNKEYHCNVINTLTSIRSTFLHIRYLLRAIGEVSHVDIESKQQQELCDSSMNVPGVLCSGVPGAGGEDAVFAILLSNDNDIIANVEEVWNKMSESSGRRICRLHVQENKSGLTAGTVKDLYVR